MRRPPVPLLVVLLVAGVQALAWSVLVPAFQGPDELEHYAYVQRLAETRQPTWTALETLPPGTAPSRETEVARTYLGLRPLVGNAAARPLTEEIDVERWKQIDATLTDADQTAKAFTPAFRNPPLYYLYEAVVYAPVAGADVMTRQYVLRWATLPFFLIAVLMAWLLAGEVFGRRRWLQAVAALFVALQPVLANLGGLVNPDAAIAAIIGTAFWLAAVIVNRGLSRGRVLGAVATAAAAILIHGRAAPVVFILAAAFAVRMIRAARGNRRRLGATVAGLAAAVAAVVGVNVWYALKGEVTASGVRQFGSYVWQVYLPRLSFMEPSPRADWTTRDIFVDRLWSGLLAFEVGFPDGLLDAISIATMVAGALVIATMLWRRDAVRSRLGLVAVFVVGLAGSLLLMHSAAFRDLVQSENPVITGRYLVPFLPLAGITVAAVAASLPRRFGPAAATLVLGLEALVALGLLGAAVVRFHV